jgi:F0F1-type ATP synthase delta subunit
MTSQSVIARPYAEAAFSVAKQDNSIEEWSSDLQKIKEVCEDQKITNILPVHLATPPSASCL